MCKLEVFLIAFSFTFFFTNNVKTIKLYNDQHLVQNTCQRMKKIPQTDARHHLKVKCVDRKHIEFYLFYSIFEVLFQALLCSSFACLFMLHPCECNIHFSHSEAFTFKLSLCLYCVVLKDVSVYCVRKATAFE